MSGSRQLAEHMADLLAPLGPVTVRRFFGGFGLHRRGTLFAIVMDTLYFRVNERGRAMLASRGGVPFRYQASGRTVVVERFYSPPADALDDPEALVEVARQVAEPPPH